MLFNRKHNPALALLESDLSLNAWHLDDQERQNEQ